MTHRNGWTISATVTGIIRFPEHPTHCGALGLEGGEDVQATRDSFRSIGEAMTWARKVLDEQLVPRWEPFGELLTPHTTPGWSTARVVLVDHWDYDADDRAWTTYDGTREWREEEQGAYSSTLGAVVRTD